jgi:ABC-type hemin transport system ATPase subunit
MASRYQCKNHNWSSIYRSSELQWPENSSEVSPEETAEVLEAAVAQKTAQALSLQTARVLSGGSNQKTAQI